MVILTILQSQLLKFIFLRSILSNIFSSSRVAALDPTGNYIPEPLTPAAASTEKIPIFRQPSSRHCFVSIPYKKELRP